MKRTALARKTPLKASVSPQKPRKPLSRGKAAPKAKLRKGTIYKAINPATGRVISVKTAKGKAWKAFAAFIRARDPYCITCGARTTEAGHFLHTTDKENKALGGNMIWYNEQNVNGQDGHCNRHKSGAGAIYAVKLEEKYGDGTVKRLYELLRTERKWTIPELLEIESIYREKLRELGV